MDKSVFEGFGSIEYTNYCDECELDKTTEICKEYNEKLLKIGDKYLRCSICWQESVSSDFQKAIETFKNMKDDPKAKGLWKTESEE